MTARAMFTTPAAHLFSGDRGRTCMNSIGLVFSPTGARDGCASVPYPVPLQCRCSTLVPFYAYAPPLSRNPAEVPAVTLSTRGPRSGLVLSQGVGLSPGRGPNYHPQGVSEP